VRPAPDGLVVYRIEVGGAILALFTWSPERDARFPALTPSERDVLRALLAGKTNRDIAVERGTAVRTVANQIARLFRKVGVRSRAELAARWFGA
jgi:DNA-binding NarL/FixJ family response regulator